jgi:tyrosine-protein kinase Etk/Wzc
VTPESYSLSAKSSITLAMSLADELKRPVLLVDASLKSAEATRVLGCTGERGLTDFLAETSLSIAELALQTTHPQVSFLPAGTRATSGSPALPEQLTALFEAIFQDYDFLILSGGSVLNESMALALAPHVGCVLLLAIENETTVDDLDAAQHALDFCRARKVGLVLTTPPAGESWLSSR